jgi:hypothetical protein
MDANPIRAAAAGLAVNRIALGLVYLVKPRSEAGRWVGEGASRKASTVLTRGLASRDVALGAGALWALRSEDADPRPWFAAQALADTSDFASTLAVKGELPSSGVKLGAALAGASAVVAAAAALLLEN